MVKIGAIIQARMGSSRLPGKILMKMPLGGSFSILQHVIQSLKRSKKINGVLLATTVSDQDDILEQIANLEQIGFYRGSVDNVLLRFYEANKTSKFDQIVRITSDNPFIDVDLLDELICSHIEKNSDYTKSVGLPLGMNFEIFSAKSLTDTIKSDDLTTYDLEHVTPYIIKSEKFVKNVVDFSDRFLLDCPIRLTVDYPSDFAVANILYLLVGNEIVTISLIEKLLKKYPWIMEINQHLMQKKLFYSVKEEINEAIKQLDLLGLDNAKYILQEKLNG